MKRHTIATGVACLGLLSACGGGGQTSAESDGTTTFSAYKASVPAISASAPALGVVAADTVRRHTREWAVSTLMASRAISTSGTSFTGNDVAIPPLHFARVQMTAAAAYGDTLKQMTDALPAAAEPALALALARGVTRSVSAGPQTRVTDTFMQALTAAGRPDTWAAMQLNELNAAALALQPNLRLSIDDTLNTTLTWPAVAAFDGVFDAGGLRRLGPMLRASGQGFNMGGSDAAIAGMLLAGGRWLLRIEPTGSIHTFTAAQLDAALGAAVDRAALAPSGPLTMVLPDGAAFSGVGLHDLRGMALAFDPKLADLRTIDGLGGLYAGVFAGSAGLSVGTGGLALRGLLSTWFIFNPDNVNAGSGGGGPGFGSGITFVDFPPVWLVPCGSADLRPAYIALIDERGAVQMLARWTMISGQLCQS